MTDTPRKTLRPSPSFRITVPAEVIEDYDTEVLSLWLSGKPLVVQLSSYGRLAGNQVSAHERLSGRIAKHPHAWTLWTEHLHPNEGIDQATAEYVDPNGVLWIHSYLVWPHVTVYVLISGPAALLRSQPNWAMEAAKSIDLSVH